MKRVRIVEVSIMMSSVLICVVMIGLIHLAHEPLIVSAEYMSLKELAQVAHGIRVMITEVIEMNPIDITLLMIYLANADQLQKHNTMIQVSLVHDEWSTR